jgi:hypothetical protein
MNNCEINHKKGIGMNKVKGSAVAQGLNVVEIKTNKSAEEVEEKITKEMERLHNQEDLISPKTARGTLINYMNVMQENVIYLTELGDVRLLPVIDSTVNLIAKFRYWLT